MADGVAFDQDSDIGVLGVWAGELGVDLGDLADVVWGVVADSEDCAGLVDEVREVTDILSCLEFVTGDHYNFDLGLL